MNLNRWLDVWRRFSGKGVYPHELAFMLDCPLRKLILPAGRLIDTLRVDKKLRVLEIGPGPGYFSLELAGRLSEGELILFDIQREMLLKSRNKLSRAGFSNFGLVQGNAEQLPFSASSFDLVFMVTVLGEVPDPGKCMKNIGKVLRPEGVLSLTEQDGDPDSLTENQISKMGWPNGLRTVETSRFRGGFTVKMTKVPARAVDLTL